MLRLLFFSIILVVLDSCNFAPGSYPYAETYEFQVNEDVLLEAIKQFRKEHPEYLVPEEIQLREGRRNEGDYWYRVNFYYPDTNQILHCWIRQTRGKERTTFAFVSINNGLKLGNWRDINHDYSGTENKRQIDKFESTILNGIKQHLTGEE